MAKPTQKGSRNDKRKIEDTSFFSGTAALGAGAGHYFLPVCLVLSCLVFLPTFQNQFVNLDDTLYVVENAVIKTINSENLKTIFSGQFVGNYQPLTMLLYMVEYKFFGLHPWGYHAISLIFHLLGTLLVFLIIKKLSGSEQIAFLTSLLFGIHPLHVESVAWVAEQKDVLYGFFFLWSLYFYIPSPGPAKEGTSAHTFFLTGRMRSGVCLLLFALALLSKAQAVVLPVIFFAVDFLGQRKITKKTILEKLPFFFLALVCGVVALKVQGKAGAMQTFQYFPFYERILFSCYALLIYLYKLILPVNLSCFYPYPETGDKINTVWVYLSPVVLLAITFLGWNYLRKSNPPGSYGLKEKKVVVFGAAFFLVTLLLVLQLLPIGDALYADRYTYIPSIGLFFIAAYYAIPLLKSKVAVAVAMTYLFFFCYLAFQRTKAWHDSITLYTDAIEKGYRAPILYNNRGAVFSDSSRNEEALKDFSSLVLLKPRYPNGWRNKGLVHQRLGQQEEAIHSFSEAIHYYPDDYRNYLSRGTLYVQKNDFESAIKDFTKITQLQPESGEGYYARSEAYGKSNRLTEALADIDKAIEFSPGNGQAYNNRGIIYSMSGKFPEAVDDFTRSLELKPDNLNPYTNRALAYRSMGKFPEAYRDMMTAKEKGMKVDENIVNELKTKAGIP